jgi:hypothetical protein
MESVTTPIDRSVLTPLVQQALGREDAEIDTWQVQPVTGGVELTASLQRFSGEARAVTTQLPWSLILKIVQRPSGQDDNPQGLHYWKREALAYQSGLLNDLPGSLAAPRCYASYEPSDGTSWIWMEDIRDEIGHWPLEFYGDVARCLGRFNGAYVADCPLPTQAWLSRKWLRQYIERAAPAVERLIDSLDHPLIRRALPGITPDFIRQVWDERYTVLEIIERMPQTLCHLDAFRRNLFARRRDGRDQIVAVDWSYAGIAAIGEELAPLVNASVGFGAVALSDALRLEQIALEGYLAGLYAVGWRGDPKQVKFSYAATLYWRYAIGGFAGEMVPYMLDESTHAAVEAAWGLSMEQLADATAASLNFSQHVYAEARQLKKRL